MSQPLLAAVKESRLNSNSIISSSRGRFAAVLVHLAQDVHRFPTGIQVIVIKILTEATMSLDFLRSKE